MMSGVTTLPLDNTMAGGEGIPMLEPPLSVGTASTSDSSRFALIGKENSSGVTFERCYEVHAPATLRQPECARVDHPIGPPITQVFKGCGDDVHRRATPQLKHEGHVFQEHPRGFVLFDQTKDFAYEA